ncbi:MAG: 6-bladed beta-propeller [Firmicutes bacterium]|nr:6-bladed beta-propeller [Bacillota bacterium]
MPKWLAGVLSVLLFFTIGVTVSAEVQDRLVWPLPPQEPKIQFVKAISTSKDIGMEKPSFLRKLVLGNEPPKVFFVKPYGVAADSKGRIYVTDTGIPRVAVFDPANKKAWYIGNEGRGQLSLPIGITVDSNDNIYVADAMQRQVLVYTPEGEVIHSIGDPTLLTNPTGVALDPEEKVIYIADSKSHCIFVFSKETGEVINKLGKPGVGPGQFNYPTNLFVDREGNLYVTDTMNFRIQAFDPEGKYLCEFGKAGDTGGCFARPKGVAVDSFGHIYVIDAAFNNFQIFNAQKQLLLFVGTGGQGLGQFRLPAGIFIDDNNYIYVVDQLNARIQIFRFLAGE